MCIDTISVYRHNQEPEATLESFSVSNFYPYRIIAYKSLKMLIFGKFVISLQPKGDHKDLMQTIPISQVCFRLTDIDAILII